MKQFDFRTLGAEPYLSGVLAGLSTLFAIVSFNLIGNLEFVSSQVRGPMLLVVALGVSLLSGVLVAKRLAKSMHVQTHELGIAHSLANGDLPDAILRPDELRSHMSLALANIANRHHAIERVNAKLMQEAATRESQLLFALDCLVQEVLVFDRNGLLVCANSAYLSKCNAIGAVIALGMTKREVWAEIAKAPGANLPLNERQSWLKAQEDLRYEAFVSRAAVSFVSMNGEPSEISVKRANDGHHVEIIESTGKLLALFDRAAKAEREASANQKISQATLSRLRNTIRTPMTGVLAAADLLNKSSLDEKQRLRVDIIRRSAGTLLGIVEDMFDSSSNIEVPENSMQLSGYVEGANATLELSTETHFSKVISADDQYDNSKNVDPHLDDDIARPDLRLFADMLSQTKTPHEIQNLLEVATGQNSVMPKVTQQLDLLIIETSEVRQIYLTNSLADKDFSFKVVGTGAQGVEIAKSEKPRFILTDISIPDMDGLRVAAAIRANLNYDDAVPVIVGLANQYLKGDANKCIAAGIDHYFGKPDTAEELINLIHAWLKPELLKKAS